MGYEEQFDDELKRMEQELARLAPKAGRLDHGQLMYLAGRESAVIESSRRAPREWYWPAATSLMTLVAAVCAALWLMPREPLVVEKIVYVNRPVENTAAQDAPSDEKVNAVQPQQFRQATSPDIWHVKEPRRLSSANYLHARQIALTRGVDQLPTVAYGGSSVDAPKSYRELQQSLIGRQIDSREPPRIDPIPTEFEQGDNT